MRKSTFKDPDNLFGKSVPRTSVIEESRCMILSNDELNRMKNKVNIKIDSGGHIEDQEYSKIKTRKENMKKLQALQFENDKDTQESQHQDLINMNIVKSSASKRLNGSDIVKQLNTMASRATAFTMRTKQLEEKKQREEKEIEYNERMNLIMEINRLQDLKRREDEEATKFNKRIEDRKIIVEQIEERKRSQLLAAEARAQENETMRNLMAKYAAEDAVQAMRRKQQVENSRVEVLQANEDAINRKRNNKLEAQQEMECILEYQRKRDAELKRREDEEAFIERAKVARQAQLLAEQERVINNADKRDEILARRFAEQKDRCERQKEAEAKRKRLDDARLLMQSRERAAEQKKRLAAELQKLEMDETNHMASQLEKLHMEERLASEEKRQRDMLFRDFLLEQAAESKTKRQLDRGRKYSEGADARHAEKDELAKLNELRSAMVKELSDQGVDPRFLAEIKAVNIEKLLQQV